MLDAKASDQAQAIFIEIFKWNRIQGVHLFMDRSIRMMRKYCIKFISFHFGFIFHFRKEENIWNFWQIFEEWRLKQQQMKRMHLSNTSNGISGIFGELWIVDCCLRTCTMNFIQSLSTQFLSDFRLVFHVVVACLSTYFWINSTNLAVFLFVSDNCCYFYMKSLSGPHFFPSHSLLIYSFLIQIVDASTLYFSTNFHLFFHLFDICARFILKTIKPKTLDLDFILFKIWAKTMRSAVQTAYISYTVFHSNEFISKLKQYTPVTVFRLHDLYIVFEKFYWIVINTPWLQQP